MKIDVTIEVPAGSRNKYELDHATGVLWLTRTLFTAARFPADYGYVEDTEGPDGDPIDALVHLDEPGMPGCRVHCRAVALLWIETADGPEPKILCVPEFAEPGWKDLPDVPERFRREIGQFFEVYKDIQSDPDAVRVGSWENAAAAARAIRKYRKATRRRR